MCDARDNDGGEDRHKLSRSGLLAMLVLVFVSFGFRSIPELQLVVRGGTFLVPVSVVGVVWVR